VSVRVKICGVTSPEDAAMCADAGADAIGVNFIASSKRRVDVSRAREIAAAARGVLIVGVVADMSVEAMLRLREEAALGCLQLHGDEPPEVLAALLPHAYKAVRVGDAADAARALAFPGDYVLVDAKVAGALGGTGQSVDFALVAPIARARRLTLAGGLTPENVAAAIREVAPWCVDVASGVERDRPGIKDEARVRAFIAAAKASIST
jgi:phosphoribosylanthranilate isomerase